MVYLENNFFCNTSVEELFPRSHPEYLKLSLEMLFILMAASELDNWTDDLLLKEFVVFQYCNSVAMLQNFEKYLWAYSICRKVANLQPATLR